MQLTALAKFVRRRFMNRHKGDRALSSGCNDALVSCWVCVGGRDLLRRGWRDTNRIAGLHHRHTRGGWRC